MLAKSEEKIKKSKEKKVIYPKNMRFWSYFLMISSFCPIFAFSSAGDIKAIVDDSRVIYQKIVAGLNLGYGEPIHAEILKEGQNFVGKSGVFVAIGQNSSAFVGKNLESPGWVSIFGAQKKFKHPPKFRVDLEVPLIEELELLKSLRSDGDVIGVFYHPVYGRNQFLASKILAMQLGLNMVGMPIYSERDIIMRLNEQGSRLKFIWLMNDQAVFRSEFLSKLSTEVKTKKIAVVGGGANVAARGALAALSINFIDTGNKVGKLIRKDETQGIAIIMPALQLNYNVSLAENLVPESSIRVQRHAKEKKMRFVLQ